MLGNARADQCLGTNLLYSVVVQVVGEGGYDYFVELHDGSIQLYMYFIISPFLSFEAYAYCICGLICNSQSTRFLQMVPCNSI